MSGKVLAFICFTSLIHFGYTVSLPITKCAWADSKCLRSSSQAVISTFAKGLPEYGVETLDPAVFSKPIDASANGLKLIVNDFVVTGLKDCDVKKISRDALKNKIMGKLLCNVEGIGQYDMEGNLLILKVQGKGKLRVQLRKVIITLDADLTDKVGKDGKKYWDIKRFSHTFELQDKADVEFENLFAGNDVLGRAATEVISSSGNDIILEVGPPVIQVIVTKVVSNIKKFFSHVPVEELSLD